MNILETRLSENGIRPTAMRLLVLKRLSELDAAISLSDLEHSFAKSDRITLYRTIKTFQDKGLVHGIDDGTGAPKYALQGSDRTMHVHFHCRTCKETYCLPKTRIPDIRLPDRFMSDEANLVMKGHCQLCSNG